MELKELKRLLQQPYKTENWRALLGYVFEYVQFLDTPIVIPTGDARVNQLKQYGTVRLSDGKNLALFELTLNEKVDLIHNRVGLNELVKKYIDQDSYHGILSIFEQGKDDYRFTFTARNTEYDKDQGFIDKDTDTKRFTYILGANESCRTAAERFDALSKIDNKDIKAVEDAFNVEKLSKKFFKEYIEQFDSLVAYLKSKPTFYKAIFENDETATRNFVKRFMGRLVFLKFIQKKGWLGVPITEKGWHNGDFQFLENQFKGFKDKGSFVSQFLNPLFYEALNVGYRPKDEFQDRGYKIPYLSGGLFDSENPKENRIDFEEKELTNLFDFFERYNFTIDENDLHDKEVGIDPEMLGHIFENLLEDNKDKGAFYTPKEIVRYMCQESLKEYLKTYLESNKLWPSDEKESKTLEETLAAFVEKKETAKILRYDKELATALRDVKICDPAIGSGAFPMGLLNEIFTLIKNLHEESPDRVGDVWGMHGKTWQPNIVKQNIIQNSIYGVDIEAGAVDIARLRFWLSLVIEEIAPPEKGLPHLDYKIVVGNSLVSKLEDTIIDIEWDLKPQLVQADIYGNEGKVSQKRELIREITALQKQVFEPDSDEEVLSIHIRNNKIDLLVLQLKIMIDEKGVTDKPQGTVRNIAAMTQKWLETKGWQQQITKLHTMKQGTQTPLEFFDWRLDFPEVLTYDSKENPNPGFDIVIGNPPYVSAVNMARNDTIKSHFKLKYPTATGSYDLYLLFIIKGIELSKEGGNFNWIIPNKFLVADYAERTRNKLISENSLYRAVNVSSFNVFSGVGVYPIILSGLIHKSKGFEEFDIEEYKHLEQRIFKKPTSLKEYETFSKFQIKILSGATGFEAQVIKPYINSTKNGIPFVVSGSIDRYKWGNSDVRYMKDRYLDAYISIDANVSKSKLNFWKSPKIVIAGMTKTIEAVYVDKPLALGVGVYGIYNFAGYDPYALTALLNSRFITYYFTNKFRHKHLAGGYLAINKGNILEFPLVEISKKNMILLKGFSEEMHYGNNILLNEVLIDNLVYKLYNLTYAEALCIEPELSERLSKEAYEAIEI